MLKIHPCLLDIPKMTEQQWHDLLTARLEFFNELAPNEPAPSHEAQRQSLSAIPELRDQVVFWLFYDDAANPVGWMTMTHPKPENPDFAANKDRIYVEPVVLAPYRHQGVGTQLLPLIVDYARTAGASWIEWDTKFESGFCFSEKIGASVAGQQRTNRLMLDQLDWELLRRWVEAGRANNPDVELMRIEHQPAPDILDKFCDLHAHINRLQPRDDVEGISYTLTPDEFMKETRRLEDRKIERLIICTRQPDGKLSGMTDFHYNQAKPTYASVRLTGVRREYQGRGLGKWLKAAMMLDVRQRYPGVKYVDTDNFNNNDPMLSINDRMGFKLFEQYIFYKIRTHELAARIASGGI